MDFDKISALNKFFENEIDSHHYAEKFRKSKR